VGEQVAHFLAYGHFDHGEGFPHADESALLACDAEETEPWVRDLRDRILAFDGLGRFAVESFGAPLACFGAVDAEFDGLPFGAVVLDFSEGVVLTARTQPPEASTVTLHAPAGFENEAEAFDVLVRYTERVGLGIDWSAPDIAAEDGAEIHRFRDPEPGLNASATLRYASGSLIEISLSLAL
jgi:hypothetical protein